MKRFMLFAGFSYYPQGGWADFRASFETKAEAETAAAALSPYDADWIQIVDGETGEILEKRVEDSSGSEPRLD